MTSKNRKIAVTIIAAILSLITLWIAAGFCSVIDKPLINTNDISSVTFDGADFTLLAKGCAAVGNGVIVGGFIVLMLILEFTIMPTAWGIFRYLAFRKNPSANAEELPYAWKVFLISNTLMLAAALVIMIVCSVKAGNGGFFNALWFCWQEPLFMWAIYISKLKKIGI